MNRRQALAAAYAPAQFYQAELQKRTAEAVDQAKAYQEAQKLAQEARDQLARTTEATRVRVESGAPISPYDVEFLRGYVASASAAGAAAAPISAKEREAMAGVVTGTPAEQFGKKLALVGGNPEKRAAAAQILLKESGGIDQIGNSVYLKTVEKAGLGAQAQSILAGTVPAPTRGGPSAKDVQKADAIAAALREQGPSGFVGGTEGRAWRESLSPDQASLLDTYVGALSDSTDISAALAKIPADKLAEAQTIYRDAIANSGFTKAQAPLYSAAQQTALRAAQEAEQAAAARAPGFVDPVAAARSQALSARGVVDQDTALRSLFAGTKLANQLDLALNREGYQPQTPLEKQVYVAWQKGVPLADLESVLGTGESAASPGWSDAATDRRTHRKTPSAGSVLGADKATKAANLREAQAMHLAMTLRKSELQAGMSPEEWDAANAAAAERRRVRMAERAAAVAQQSTPEYVAAVAKASEPLVEKAVAVEQAKEALRAMPQYSDKAAQVEAARQAFIEKAGGPTAPVIPPAVVPKPAPKPVVPKPAAPKPVSAEQAGKQAEIKARQQALLPKQKSVTEMTEEEIKAALKSLGGK